MPLYSLQEFQDLVRADRWGYFNQRRPYANLEKLGWSDEYFAIVLCSLVQQRDFQKTVKDCAIHDVEDLELIDADQYSLNWDEEFDVGRKSIEQATICLSLKIAILRNEDGNHAGVVTFHT